MVDQSCCALKYFACLVICVGVLGTCSAEDFIKRTEREWEFCPGFCDGLCRGSKLSQPHCKAFCDTGCMDTGGHTARLSNPTFKNCDYNGCFNPCNRICFNRGIGVSYGGAWNACMLRCITQDLTVTNGDYKAIYDFWIHPTIPTTTTTTTTTRKPSSTELATTTQKPSTCKQVCTKCNHYDLDPPPEAPFYCWGPCLIGCPHSGGSGVKTDVARAETLFDSTTCDSSCYDSCFQDCNTKFKPEASAPWGACLYYCQTGSSPGRLSDNEHLLLADRFGRVTCESFCVKCHNFELVPQPQHPYRCTTPCLIGCPGAGGAGGGATGLAKDLERAAKLFTNCNNYCFDSCYDDCATRFEPHDNSTELHAVCLFYCMTGQGAGRLTGQDFTTVSMRFNRTTSTTTEAMTTSPALATAITMGTNTNTTKPTTSATIGEELNPWLTPSPESVKICCTFCDKKCRNFKSETAKPYNCDYVCQHGCPGASWLDSGAADEAADLTKANKLFSGCNASCYDSCSDDCDVKFRPRQDLQHAVCLFVCQTGSRNGQLTNNEYILLRARFNKVTTTTANTTTDEETTELTAPSTIDQDVIDSPEEPDSGPTAAERKLIISKK